MTEYTILVISNVEGIPKLPKWKRTYIITAANELFLSAGVFMDETKAFLMAAFDGAATIHEGGHVYISADWMRDNFPNDSEIEAYDKMVAKILCDHAEWLENEQ